MMMMCELHRAWTRVVSEEEDTKRCVEIYHSAVSSVTRNLRRRTVTLAVKTQDDGPDSV